MWLREKKAASQPEKKAEQMSEITNRTNRTINDSSKKYKTSSIG